MYTSIVLSDAAREGAQYGPQDVGSASNRRRRSSGVSTIKLEPGAARL
jgi:hypothetical protein